MIPYDTIIEHAAARPQAVALAADTGQLSWAEYAEQVRALSAWLTTRLSAADHPRAVVMAPATPATVVATSALATLGIPWVGLDATAAPDRVRAQIAAVSPAVAVVDSSRTPLPDADRNALGLPDGVVVLDLAGSSTPGGVANQPVGTPLVEAIGYAGPAASWQKPPFLALGFTSGTTGTPKLVLRRRASEARRLAMLEETFGFGPADTHLVTVPLSHASGHGWARVFLAVGATVVLGDADPVANLARMRAWAVRTTLMVPPVLDRFLTAAGAAPEVALPHLRFLLTGGRHLAPAVVRRCHRRFGPVLHLYYGTTETGLNTIATPAHLAADPRSAGQPTPGTSLLVLDERTGQRTPPGTVGRVAIASYMNFDGYADRAASTVVRDGAEYVVTADYGYLDGDGQLFLTARSDQTGAGTGPVDVIGVEGALRDLDGVADAVLASTSDGSVAGLTAALLPTPANGVQPDAVLERAERLLARLLGDLRGRPAAVVVARIPYSPTGKVDLPVLVSMVKEQK